MNDRFKNFFDTVMEYYGEHGRHDLPWRKNQTPYRVAVSEIMLQQTQASRVVPFFKDWMKQFPSWKALASAPQSEVLGVWKGLGYNSRALRLQKLAQVVTNDYRGRLPKEYEELLQLPGIGPYTAGAIRAFAHNLYTPIIETNIRRIFIHHFFRDDSDVSDREIFEVIQDMGDINNPREWYEALMDYGSILPNIINHNPNKQSKHYTKQSKFEGSDRQLRGRILEILLEEQKKSRDELFKKLIESHPRESRDLDTIRYQRILDQMEQEGFLRQTKKEVSLS